jgi:hypothetical protein
MTMRWRDIPGWAGNYKISSEGQVLSVARHCRTRNHFGVETTRRVPPKILRLTYSGGRVRVQLCRDGVAHSVEVHAAVLCAFRRPRPPGYFAEHVNGDPTDNRLSNLRWARRRGDQRFGRRRQKATA